MPSDYSFQRPSGPLPSGSGGQSGPSFGSPASATIDFKSILFVVLEKAWLIALSILIAVLVTAWQVKKAPRLYSATATIQIDPDEQRVVKIEKVQQEDTRAAEALKTIEQTLRSRPLMEREIGRAHV